MHVSPLLMQTVLFMFLFLILKVKNGQYSVRSAYFGAMEDLIDNSHLRVQGAWMNIWWLKIPQKVRSLMCGQVADCWQQAGLYATVQSFFQRTTSFANAFFELLGEAVFIK